MQRGYANVRELVKTAPSLLPLVKDRILLTRVVNDFIPYKVGIEVEVNTKPLKVRDYNEELDVDRGSELLVKKGHLLRYSHDAGEKRFLFPAGVRGLIGVEEVCDLLKKTCYFNDESGIHCNVSLEHIPDHKWDSNEFKKKLFENHYNIISMLDVYDYEREGSYNSANHFCWAGKSSYCYRDYKKRISKFPVISDFETTESTDFGWYAYRGGNANSFEESCTDYRTLFRGKPQRIEIRIPPCIFEYKDMIAMIRRCCNVVKFISNL